MCESSCPATCVLLAPSAAWRADSSTPAILAVIVWAAEADWLTLLDTVSAALAV